MFNFPDLCCQAHYEKWLREYQWSLSSLPDVHFRGWLSLLGRPRTVAPTPKIASGKDMAGVADAKTEAWTCIFGEERWYEINISKFSGITRKFGVLVLKFFVRLVRCFEYIQVCGFWVWESDKQLFEERRVAYLFYLGEEVRRLYSKMCSFLPQYQIITPKEWFYFGSMCCGIICQKEHFIVNSCLLIWMLQLYF